MALTGQAIFASETGTDGAQRVVPIAYVLEAEGDTWVATCVELGASSFGDTIDEALDGMFEAVGLLLDEAEAQGYLEAYLRERNLRPQSLKERATDGTRWRVMQPAPSA